MRSTRLPSIVTVPCARPGSTAYAEPQRNDIANRNTSRRRSMRGTSRFLVSVTSPVMRNVSTLLLSLLLAAPVFAQAPEPAATAKALASHDRGTDREFEEVIK